MKKLLCAALAALLVFSLAACAKTGQEETTAEPESTEPVSYQGPSLEEMSPPSMSTAVPLDLPKTYGAVDKSGFKPIKKEDSRWPESEATSVYRSGNTEYYIMDGGMVFLLIADEETGDVYSASYDKEGRLAFFGDETKNWYFTEDGAFDYMMYTYTTLSGAQVVTFYEGEDTRFAVYAGNTYYDGELNELTGPQQIQLVTRVAAGFSMMGGMNSLG